MRGLYGSSPDVVWKALTAAQGSLVAVSVAVIDDLVFLISSKHLGGEKKVICYYLFRNLR